MAAIDEKFIQTGRIQYVFKDFPIAQLHPGAILAHQATRCAAEQGRFWEMHTGMFTPPGSHGAEALEAKAAAAGVSLGPYRECMTSNRTLEGVQTSVDTAARLGANGTPSFFVGLRDPATNRVRIVQTISGAHPVRGIRPRDHVGRSAAAVAERDARRSAPAACRVSDRPTAPARRR